MSVGKSFVTKKLMFVFRGLMANMTVGNILAALSGDKPMPAELK